MEETPRYETASALTPYRVSTVHCWLPIQTARIGPAPSHIDRGDELRNTEGAPPLLLDTFEPDGNITVRGYLNQLVFLLHMAGLVGTPTPGNGVITDPDAATIPAGATRWVFTKRGGVTAKTAQIIAAYEPQAVFLRGQGFGVSQIGLNAAGDVSADLMGLVLGRIADPVLTKAYDAPTIVPIQRADLQLTTWLASSGNADDFNFTITNPLVRYKSMAAPARSFFPDKMEHGDDRVRLTGSVPMRNLTAADIDALLAASTFSAKARWQSSKVIGATTYKYSMWLEMPACQYSAMTPDELANRRRFGGSFDFWAAWDDAAGYDFKLTVVNATPAVETYV